MNLPSIDDYINALHFDTALAQYAHLEPVKKDDGSLYFSSGNFAVVFKMRCKNTGKFFALKVFHRYQEGRIENYKLISECLENNTSDYLVKYHFLEKEIWVNSNAGDAEYPAIVMDWVEGKTLGNTLQDLCKTNNTQELKNLAYAFDEMALWLLKQEFAHGDLKSDNILVDSQKQMKLVDYDGLYTPTMAGHKARENGSPHFRHPKRDINHFGKHIDDFSLLLLSLSLHALAQEPNLIGQYGAGDSILFTESELASPGQSSTWQNMTKYLSNTAIAPRYALLHMACANFSNVRVLGLDAVLGSNSTVIEQKQNVIPNIIQVNKPLATPLANITTVTDIDGNVYTTVTIGTQTWMVENLKTTRFNDGTTIPLVTDYDVWINGETPKMCFYDNDIANKAKYGALYNWHVVNTEKLAPKGWHVPTDKEWQTLVDFLGGEEEAGRKLRSPSDWKRIKTGINLTNEFSFNSLPGGTRYYSIGTFHYLGDYGFWWSASANDTDGAWVRDMHNDNGDVSRDDYDPKAGISVRCIRD
jgi:uncharacterized protein (TIGR02145 family)